MYTVVGELFMSANLGYGYGIHLYTTLHSRFNVCLKCC